MTKEHYFANLIADARLEDVPIKKLKLDIGNVRYTHIDGKRVEKELEELMLENPRTHDLCDQILAAKTVLEPLVINHEYIVIEGNRRLVCLRLLDRAAKKGQLVGIPKGQFSKVKCRVLSKDTNQITMDLYLSTIHVGRKLPWKLYNRSRHIHRLRFVHAMTYDDIVDNTGLSRPVISRSLIVYKLIEKYKRMFPDDKQWFRKYNYFEELFRKKDLKEYREIKGFPEKFMKWVYQKKFKDSRDVRKLSEVLSHPRAMNVFEKHNFAESLKIIEMEKPEYSDRDFKRINDTILFFRGITRSKLVEIHSNAAKHKLIVALEAEAKKLLIELEEAKKAIPEK